jgi:NTE family protein
VTALVAPDVVVLAGGGIVGEAWMTGVVGGLADAGGPDLRQAESFVGTSAGAIVAARLAAGRPPRRPDGASPEGATGAAEAHGGLLRGALRWGWALTAPLAPLVFSVAEPGSAIARAAFLSRAPAGGRSLESLRERVAGWGAAFDGRLRVCCVDRRSGRRVVFGSPGAPDATVDAAVAASCAIPWLFAPVTIGGRDYVDGGVWSATNLDAAPARRDTEVLCLDPTAASRARWRRAFAAALAIEHQMLRVRGARVRHVVPDAPSTAAIGERFMDGGAVAPALAAGFAQGRALARGGGAAMASAGAR